MLKRITFYLFKIVCPLVYFKIKSSLHKLVFSTSYCWFFFLNNDFSHPQPNRTPSKIAPRKTMKIAVKKIAAMIPKSKYLAMRLKLSPMVPPTANSFTVSAGKDMMNYCNNKNILI